MRTSIVRLGFMLAFAILAVVTPVTVCEPASQAGFALPPGYEAKATEYMNARVDVTDFNGAALVAYDGKPVFRAAYGLADRSFDVLNTPDTKYRLGSVTKSFTATAILLLESRGALKLDDPVSRYIPDWPANWGDATIHHLLTHTAGLPRLTTSLPLMDVSGLSRSVLPTIPASVISLATTAERLQPLDFAPGTSFDYSNIGFVVLGEVIERISGQPYSRFMQENVFSPLGMTRTGIEDPTTVEKQMARGYARVDERFADAGYVDLRLVGGAGALHSTVDDLLLLDRALHDGSLLPESLQQRLFTPERMEYAKGWWVQTQFGRRVQWHRGNVQGFVATIVRYPDDGLFVA